MEIAHEDAEVPQEEAKACIQETDIEHKSLYASRSSFTSLPRQGLHPQSLSKLFQRSKNNTPDNMRKDPQFKKFRPDQNLTHNVSHDEMFYLDDPGSIINIKSHIKKKSQIKTERSVQDDFLQNPVAQANLETVSQNSKRSKESKTIKVHYSPDISDYSKDNSKQSGRRGKANTKINAGTKHKSQQPKIQENELLQKLNTNVEKYNQHQRGEINNIRAPRFNDGIDSIESRRKALRRATLVDLHMNQVLQQQQQNLQQLNKEINNKKASRRGIDQMESRGIDSSNKTEMLQKANTHEINKEVKIVQAAGQNTNFSQLSSRKTPNNMRFGSNVQSLRRISMNNQQLYEFQNIQGNMNQSSMAIPSKSMRSNFYKKLGTEANMAKEKKMTEKQKIYKDKQLQDQKRYQSIFNYWRDYDLITTILALIGLVLAVVDYEIVAAMNYKKHDPESFPNPMEDVRNQQGSTNIVRLIIVITTALAIGCLSIRQYYKVKWVNLYFKTDNDTHIYYQYNEVMVGRDDCDSIDETKHVFDYQFIFEILILLICPIPYFDMYIPMKSKKGREVIYLLSEFLVAFMWIRIYFLVRSVFNYSIYTDAYSMKLCKSYGFSANVGFTFKCHIVTNPGWTVIILFSSTIIILSYILRIFEMPYFRMAEDEWGQFDDYFMSIWCITITLTTVGYGDLVPSTKPGQYIAIITALWGAFLISLLVTIVQNVFQPDQKQIMALRHIRLTRQAAITIQYSIKYFKAKKNFHYLEQKLRPNRDPKQKFLSFGIMLKKNMQIADLNKDSQTTSPKENSNFSFNRNNIRGQLVCKNEHTTLKEIAQCEICQQNKLKREEYQDDQSNPQRIPVDSGDENEMEDQTHFHLQKEKMLLAICKQTMLRCLEKFKIESGELRKIKQDRNQEQLMTNRLIKNEVIDIADRLELMHTQMMDQTKLMLYLRDKVEKYYGEDENQDEYEGEESEEEDAGEDASVELSKHSCLKSKQSKSEPIDPSNELIFKNVFNIPTYANDHISQSKEKPQQLPSYNMETAIENSIRIGTAAQNVKEMVGNDKDQQRKDKLILSGQLSQFAGQQEESIRQSQQSSITYPHPYQQPNFQMIDSGMSRQQIASSSLLSSHKISPSQQLNKQIRNVQDQDPTSQGGSSFMLDIQQLSASKMQQQFNPPEDLQEHMMPGNVPRLTKNQTVIEELKQPTAFSVNKDQTEGTEEGDLLYTSIQDPSDRAITPPRTQSLKKKVASGEKRLVGTVVETREAPSNQKRPSVLKAGRPAAITEKDKDSQYRMSFNTIQSNMNKAEDPNFISKRRNPFYMNSMKYAGKKHKPQITNDPNLQLEDKNVFKDARVRLILVKNRRHNELEKKKTIANIKTPDVAKELDRSKSAGTLQREGTNQYQAREDSSLPDQEQEGEALPRQLTLQDPVLSHQMIQIKQIRPEAAEWGALKQPQIQGILKSPSASQRSIDDSDDGGTEKIPSERRERSPSAQFSQESDQKDGQKLRYELQNDYLQQKSLSPKTKSTKQFFFVKSNEEQKDGREINQEKAALNSRRNTSSAMADKQQLQVASPKSRPKKIALNRKLKEKGQSIPLIKNNTNQSNQ